MKIYRPKHHAGAPLYFGEETREMSIDEIERLAPDKVIIVADRTLEALHLEHVQEFLPYEFPVEPVVFNEGEGSKNLSTLQDIAGDLVRAGVTERTLILNLGGGLTLDMGGFVASLFGQGLRFAHMATTFNAGWQVATGSRQGINFAGTRNLLGVHRPPEFTIVDPYFLKTEEPRQWLSALAEFARFALEEGGGTFDRAGDVLTAEGFSQLPQLATTLQNCLEMKLEALERAEGIAPDPHAAYAASLAHAIESLGEGHLLPGESVYHAMRIAARLAADLGHMSEADFDRHRQFLASLGALGPLPDRIRTDRLVFKLHGNNKTILGEVDLRLLAAPGRFAGRGGEGKPDSLVTVSDEAIAEAVESARTL